VVAAVCQGDRSQVTGAAVISIGIPWFVLGGGWDTVCPAPPPPAHLPLQSPVSPVEKLGFVMQGGRPRMAISPLGSPFPPGIGPPHSPHTLAYPSQGVIVSLFNVGEASEQQLRGLYRRRAMAKLVRGLVRSLLVSPTRWPDPTDPLFS
jgi:hypothetical protein